MAGGTNQLNLWVLDDSADPQELDELTATLRTELLNLDVVVSPSQAGATPHRATSGIPPRRHSCK